MVQKTLAVDLMSGETGPIEALNGCLKFAQEFKDWNVIIIASKKIINEHKKHFPRNINFKTSTEEIKMNESNPFAYRQKPKSSLSIGLSLINGDQAQAIGLISSANTKIYVSAAFLTTKTIVPGIKPALLTFAPTKNDEFKSVLDSGAIVNREPEDMVQLAQMAKIFHQLYWKINNPSIGLLSNGIEEFKGDKLTRLTHKMLLKTKNINYYGLVEPTTLFENDYHILIGDGFATNILGKAAIAGSHFAAYNLKKVLNKNLFRKVCAFLLKKAFKDLKNNIISNERLGGSFFMGLDKIVFKTPGKTYAKGYYQSLKIVKELIEKDIIKKTRKFLKENEREN